MCRFIFTILVVGRIVFDIKEVEICLVTPQPFRQGKGFCMFRLWRAGNAQCFQVCRISQGNAGTGPEIVETLAGGDPQPANASLLPDATVRSHAEIPPLVESWT